MLYKTYFITSSYPDYTHTPCPVFFFWPSMHNVKDIELKCCMFHNFHTANMPPKLNSKKILENNTGK